MVQAQYVAWTAAAGEERFHRVLDAFMAEVPKKRIPGSERQEGEGRALSTRGLRKQSIDDFVGRAVSTYSNKVANAPAVGFVGDFSGLPCRSGQGNIHFDAAGAQALERGSEELAPLSAASCRIYDCEITLPQDFESPSRRRIESTPHSGHRPKAVTTP